MESVDERGEAIYGEPGDAIGTGFVNRAQLLIRYRLGDSVVLPHEPLVCACGWQTATMDQVIGRIDDTLYAPDGRALGRLDIVLKKVDGVLEAQLVQDARDHLSINLVAETAPQRAAEEIIRERIHSYFGAEMRMTFVWMDRIPRTKSGKFRFQLNKIGKPEDWPDHARV
ncbi:MAG: hypothetical protein U0V87_03070 [Acidobacteriota bacterium]